MTSLVIRVALLAFIAHAAHAASPRGCCVGECMHLDLTGRKLASVPNSLPGVSILNSSPTSNAAPCNMAVLLKVNFERLSKEGCHSLPTCGRRMLKVVLFLHENLNSTGRNWLFNIGDSRTNNGWAGDANTQYRDAELQGLNNHITAYKSDICRSGPFPTVTNAILGARRLTLLISNEYVRVITDTGVDHSICSHCLFALNGQSDPQGVNEDIYVGLNRVVSGLYRSGHGVCRASLSWACNWSGR